MILQEWIPSADLFLCSSCLKDLSGKWRWVMMAYLCPNRCITCYRNEFNLLNLESSIKWLIDQYTYFRVAYQTLMKKCIHSSPPPTCPVSTQLDKHGSKEKRVVLDAGQGWARRCRALLGRCSQSMQAYVWRSAIRCLGYASLARAVGGRQKTLYPLKRSDSFE